MEVEAAIRTRRTHKAFTDQPIPPNQLDQLLELASWAPNHHLSAPWRFRVLGPLALARLKETGGPKDAAKLERCRTLVVVSCDWGVSRTKRRRTCTRPQSPPTSSCSPPIPEASPATGAPPRFCAARRAQRAIGLGDSERFVGLIHLGYPRSASRLPSARRWPRGPPIWTDALPRPGNQAIAGERFEVVVIGGGITGAGSPLTPPRAATGRPFRSAMTTRPGPRAAPRRWSTVACATCRTSISAWSVRRCLSAS